MGQPPVVTPNPTVRLSLQDDQCAESASSRQKNQSRELCWLCSFCTHLKARQLASFIENQIQHMSNLHIAEQVKVWHARTQPHTVLAPADKASARAHAVATLTRTPCAQDNILRDFPQALGARKRDIVRHIQYHMLSPHVRMASTLRSLFGLAESIRLTIHTRDAETDDVTIDSKQVELYIKVLNQVQSAYRMDSSKLLFMETGQAAQSSFAAPLSKVAP